MPRGLGTQQKSILASLADGEEKTVRELAEDYYGENPTPRDTESVRESLKGLERRGEVVIRRGVVIGGAPMEPPQKVWFIKRSADAAAA